MFTPGGVVKGEQIGSLGEAVSVGALPLRSSSVIVNPRERLGARPLLSETIAPFGTACGLCFLSEAPDWRRRRGQARYPSEPAEGASEARRWRRVGPQRAV